MRRCAILVVLAAMALLGQAAPSSGEVLLSHQTRSYLGFPIEVSAWWRIEDNRARRIRVELRKNGRRVAGRTISPPSSGFRDYPIYTPRRTGTFSLHVFGGGGWNGLAWKIHVLKFRECDPGAIYVRDFRASRIDCSQARRVLLGARCADPPACSDFRYRSWDCDLRGFGVGSKAWCRNGRKIVVWTVTD